MRTTLGVPETMLKSLGAFVEAEGIPLALVAGDDCTVRVVQSQQGKQSTPTVLEAGGSIECSTAFQMAAKLGLKPRQIGKLANHLGVKIRACQLGCFG